jgi:hypothetical protein
MADLAGRRVLDSISSDIAAIPHAFVVSGLISHREPARGLSEIAQDLVLGLVALPWQGLEQIDHINRSAIVGGNLNQQVLPNRELYFVQLRNRGATWILRDSVSHRVMPFSS